MPASLKVPAKHQSRHAAGFAPIGARATIASSEAALNLFWLKYVSYALVACAAFLYFAIRLNKLNLRRGAKAILFSACIALSCILWHVQERNADLHSPRSLVIGTVTSVTAHAHKSASITDSFTLRLGSGRNSPEFTTTDTVARSAAQQPIHQGDLLGVLYRTWDNVPLTIDELQGQQPGWHYQRFAGALSLFIWTVAITGAFALAGALAASGRQPRPQVQSEPTLHLND